MMTGEEELRELVATSGWLTRALRVVRDSGLPDAWIGAGALRDLVWGERFGDDPIEPYRSVAEAVATRPEYATAVVVRLDPADRLEVYDLADLLGGIWRHNPARVDLALTRQRLARHRPAQRWPGVTVIEPG